MTIYELIVTLILYSGHEHIKSVHSFYFLIENSLTQFNVVPPLCYTRNKNALPLYKHRNRQAAACLLGTHRHLLTSRPNVLVRSVTNERKSSYFELPFGTIANRGNFVARRVVHIPLILFYTACERQLNFSALLVLSVLY